jgi:uncharacterized surface protein with fasciclin (FAS1) repeats
MNLFKLNPKLMTPASMASWAIVFAGACLTPQMSSAYDGAKKAASKATAKSGDIVDGAMNSSDHSTLFEAVKAAGLVETLKGSGPFTLFAPTNAAFAALPAGTLDTLLKPENKATLTKILTYHVVAGNLDSNAVVAAIKAGKGKASLTTVSGGKITASMKDGSVVITDEKGGTAKVTAVDLGQSNGVIHVTNAVLMPK